MSTADIEDMYPLTPTQQGMLFHARHSPDSAQYFVQWTAHLHGELDVAAMRAAWQAVLDRHPALRTVVVWDGLDEPLQVVMATATVPWTELDLRGRDERSQRDDVAALLLTDQSAGFDLTRAPLLRLHLVRLADTVHQLVWSFHHILLDGWSIALVLDEVLARYDGAASATGPATRTDAAPAAVPVRPYRDHVAWLRGQDLAPAERFWRARLDGVTGPTPRAVDRPAPTSAATIADHGECHAELPEADTARLYGFARANRLTVGTMVHAAWALLLARYGGTDDVVFGSVVSGRPAELDGAESMIGLFLNTLPVRVRVDDRATVLDWLLAVQAEQVRARRHEHTPLALVRSWSAVAGGGQLFDSLLSIENYRADSRPADAALRITDQRAIERTNYPLNLSVRPGPTVALKLIHDRRRIDDHTAARLVGHVATLLRSLTADAHRGVGAVPMLTEGERVQELTGWNTTSADRPQGCLHDLVAARTAEDPDAPAVVFVHPDSTTDRLTYAELDRRANQLAHRLRERGVGRESVVGLCVERSPELPVGVLGILRAGGAYLPLDPSYPAPRLEFLLRDAGVDVLVTQRHLLPALPPVGTVLCVDRDRQHLATAPDTAPVGVGATVDNLAYVIYTSGSTGRPKGVLVEHRGVGNMVAAMSAGFGVRRGDRMLQFASASFDAAFAELATTLGSGATLYLAPRHSLLPGPELLRLLDEQAITSVILTPSVLAALPAHPLPALRTLIVAGEACPPELAARWGPGRRFVNGYGPTEATVCATMHDWDGGGSLPIGRPIANTTLVLLDDRLHPVPVGLPGEVYLGGVGLARGYHGRPGLTARRFVPDPASRAPGARLYRTGDLARRLPDGTVEYLGRADDQVKLRGFRVEPGEVRAVLLRHPEVRDAAVVPAGDGLGDRHLVAYVVAGATQPRPPTPAVTAAVPDRTADLRRFLRGELPEHLVPARFVFLDELPLTPNGKLDRAALPTAPVPAAGPASDVVRHPVAGPGTAELGIADPVTGTERVIAELWCEVLGLPEVGRHDNFFDLGGHSLSLARVHDRLESRVGRSVPLVELFDHPTVHALARHLTTPEPSTEPLPGSPTEPTEPTEPPTDRADEDLPARLVAGRARVRRRRATQQRASRLP